MRPLTGAATALLAVAAPFFTAATTLAGQSIPADPQISPDGRWVAHIIHEVDQETGRPYSNLALVTTSSGRTERLTEGFRIDRTPRFSRDGRSLAWVTFVDGFWELRVRGLDTRQTRELAVGSQPHGAIAWAPAGDRIAYTRMVPEPGEETGPIHVFTVSRTGGRPTRITREGFHSGGIEFGTRLSWTPPGDAIVFSANPGGDAQLYEVEIGNGLERILAPRRGLDRDPVVSPDGLSIAYTGYDGEQGGNRTERLYIAERAGAGFPRLISRNVQHDVRHPVWSPDGRGVFAIIEEPTVDRLAHFAADGTYRIVADSLDRPADVLGSSWVGSQRFSATADSANPRFAVTTSHPDRPPEVSVGGTRLSDPIRPISSLNMRDEDPDRPELEEIRSEHGLIMGWVLRPTRDTRVRGAVMDLRQDGVVSPTRFDLARRALAGAGWAVLLPSAAHGETEEAEDAEGEGAFLTRVRELGLIESGLFRLETAAVAGAAADTGAAAPPASEPERYPQFNEATGLLRGIITWGPAVFEEIDGRTRMMLDWLDEMDQRDNPGDTP